jgi:rare lipoprotein A
MVAIVTLAGGCSVAPVRAPESKPVPVPETLPTQEPLSPYGNPEFYEVFGVRYYPLKSSAGFVERGIASWYGPDFHLRRTSSGETYDMYQMTAAHRVLPLPTYVRVTNLENRRQCVVKVNDRGPFKGDRVIDLSYAAARALGIFEPGTAPVEVRAIGALRSRPGPPGLGPAEVRSAQARPAAKSPESPKYYLQVGAFYDRANAERLRDRIVPHLRHRVRIESGVLTRRPIYRVQVGPFIDGRESGSVVERLPAAGIHQHRVVVN